jgi:hypothetical protein
MYEEEGTDENDSKTEEKARHDLELVSIRKKLIEPNQILPAAMIRSLPPRHILTLPLEHPTKPGHRMPLDPYTEPESPTALSSRRRLSPHSKLRSKSQLPEFKRREQFRLNEQDKLEGESGGDPLQFLAGNVSSLLDYP